MGRVKKDVPLSTVYPLSLSFFHLRIIFLVHDDQGNSSSLYILLFYISRYALE